MKSRFKKNWTTTEQNSAAVRPCDFPGCCGAGEYRAPKSRDHLRDYYWFCLDHVREYNKAWDYYAGLKPEEIEEAIRSDTTWHRPTWRLGANSASSRQKFGFRIDDPLGVFDDDGHAPPPTARVSSAEEEAMTVLGLEAPLTQAPCARATKSWSSAITRMPMGGRKRRKSASSRSARPIPC